MDHNDLKVILQSHVPIVVIETHEEYRALKLLEKVVVEMNGALAKWTVTEGLQSVTNQAVVAGLSLTDVNYNNETEQVQASTIDPQTALKKIKDQQQDAVFMLLDFHAHLDDPVVIRLIKEIALNHSVVRHSLVFISHSLNIPDELLRYSARFELAMPDAERIHRLLLDESKTWALRNEGTRVKADPKALKMLSQNLLGLTETDAMRLIRNAIYDDGAITGADIPNVQKAKYELIGQEGLLSFEYDTARFSEVGGLANLRSWLDKRQASFGSSDNQHADDNPKGMLLVGIQGAGKSLAAKAVAGTWGLPLLRLDFGMLYNKFFGETEKNMREALKLAQVMSPCVLWIDEIEKGIATGDSDSGTSKRVLGTLLTWMAENKHKVFIVATANNIQALPPELIRKGRLDEIFFVDLPDAKVRAEIFAIHLLKRGKNPDVYNLDMLAQECDGFSGAEIEQVVVAANYSAAARSEVMTGAHLLEEIKLTRPLSIVMAEQMAELRHWADGRTVNAN